MIISTLPTAFSHRNNGGILSRSHKTSQIVKKFTMLWICSLVSVCSGTSGRDYSAGSECESWCGTRRSFQQQSLPLPTDGRDSPSRPSVFSCEGAALRMVAGTDLPRSERRLTLRCSSCCLRHCCWQRGKHLYRCRCCQETKNKHV